MLVHLFAFIFVVLCALVDSRDVVAMLFYLLIHPRWHFSFLSFLSLIKLTIFLPVDLGQGRSQLWLFEHSSLLLGSFCATFQILLLKIKFSWRKRGLVRLSPTRARYFAHVTIIDYCGVSFYLW